MATSTTRAVAAVSTVVPHRAASTTATDSSGCHWSCQVSRNVPELPHVARGRDRPLDAEQQQPVEQPGVLQIGGLAQVEVDLAHRVPPDAQPSAGGNQVGAQKRDGGLLSGD